MISLVFVLLFIFAKTEWSPAIPINTNKETKIVYPTFFIDKTSKETHYFWCQYNTKYTENLLYYRKQKADGTLEDEESITGVTNCGQIAVNGFHDGKTIYLVFSGERQKKGNQVGNDFGYSDIWVTYSINGGNSWSQFIIINHTILEDPCKRWAPTVVFDETKKQIYILYIVHNSATNQYSIGYSIDDGTHNYYESLIETSEDTIIGLSASVGYNDVKVLHVAFIKEISKVSYVAYKYYNSNNEWSNTQLLGTGMSGAITSNPSILYIPYVGTLKVESIIEISKDNGATWTQVAISNITDIVDTVLCDDKSSKEFQIFTITNTYSQSRNLKELFGYIKTDAKEWIEAKAPFNSTETKYVPKIKCYKNDQSYLVKALTVTKANMIVVKEGTF